MGRSSVGQGHRGWRDSFGLSVVIPGFWLGALFGAAGSQQGLGAQIWGRKEGLWDGWGVSPRRRAGTVKGWPGEQCRRCDGQDIPGSSLLPGSLLSPTDKLLVIAQSLPSGAGGPGLAVRLGKPTSQPPPGASTAHHTVPPAAAPALGHQAAAASRGPW